MGCCEARDDQSGSRTNRDGQGESGPVLEPIEQSITKGEKFL